MSKVAQQASKHMFRQQQNYWKQCRLNFCSKWIAQVHHQLLRPIKSCCCCCCCGKREAALRLPARKQEDHSRNAAERRGIHCRQLKIWLLCWFSENFLSHCLPLSPRFCCWSRSCSSTEDDSFRHRRIKQRGPFDIMSAEETVREREREKTGDEEKWLSSTTDCCWCCCCC